MSWRTRSKTESIFQEFREEFLSPRKLAVPDTKKPLNKPSEFGTNRRRPHSSPVRKNDQTPSNVSNPTLLTDPDIPRHTLTGPQAHRPVGLGRLVRQYRSYSSGPPSDLIQASFKLDPGVLQASPVLQMCDAKWPKPPR